MVSLHSWPRSLRGEQPPFREWELDESASRYDNLLAAPSDATLRGMWWAWAAIAWAVGVLALVVFLGILSSRRARNNSFNVYIMCLTLPDCFLALACGMTCLLNAVLGAYWSKRMCHFQQFYITFGITANTWLNAVLTYQLHKLLRFSNRRQRYYPPTRRQVLREALAVYVYAAFLGSWGFLDASWWPFHVAPSSGLACIPIEADLPSTFFYYLCFIPLFVGIPIVYIAYVCFHIWRYKLLPPTDRRHMFVYYGRIILVFFAMWLPTLVLGFMAASWLPSWGFWAGGTWSHMQGAVSAAVALMKPDIYRAVRNFLLCRWSTENCDNQENNDSAESQRGNRLTPSWSINWTSLGFSSRGTLHQEEQAANASFAAARTSALVSDSARWAGIQEKDDEDDVSLSIRPEVVDLEDEVSDRDGCFVDNDHPKNDPEAGNNSQSTTEEPTLTQGRDEDSDAVIEILDDADLEKEMDGL